jgi:hypothetical protein
LESIVSLPLSGIDFSENRLYNNHSRKAISMILILSETIIIPAAREGGPHPPLRRGDGQEASLGVSFFRRTLFFAITKAVSIIQMGEKIHRPPVWFRSGFSPKKMHRCPKARSLFISVSPPSTHIPPLGRQRRTKDFYPLSLRLAVSTHLRLIGEINGKFNG